MRLYEETRNTNASIATEVTHSYRSSKSSSFPLEPLRCEITRRSMSSSFQSWWALIGLIIYDGWPPRTCCGPATRAIATYAHPYLGNIGWVTEPAVTTFERRNDSSVQHSPVLRVPHFIDDGILSVFDPCSAQFSHSLLHSQETGRTLGRASGDRRLQFGSVRVCVGFFRRSSLPLPFLVSPSVSIAESTFFWLRCKG